MEPVLDAATIPDLEYPLTQVQHIAVETWKHTRLIPQRFQVEFTLGIDSGHDVLCVAGTGSGKSLAFAMITFLCPDAMVWIVSLLNVIENQMAKVYNDWGISSIAVNASTLTTKVLEDIKAGTYRIVISSPETYKDTNKLRPALLSQELAHKQHITIVNEAPTIKIWGQSGFQADFLRLGDLRVFMPNPSNASMCAATATCSPSVKQEIAKVLQMRPNFVSTSYEEVADLIDRPKRFEDTKQTLVFVKDYVTAHNIAFATRRNLGQVSKAASDEIAVYHALMSEKDKSRLERRFKEGKIRIMVTTEALTMGADFPNVEMVINFLSPQALEIWLQ